MCIIGLAALIASSFRICVRRTQRWYKVSANLTAFALPSGPEKIKSIKQTAFSKQDDSYQLSDRSQAEAE